MNKILYVFVVFFSLLYGICGMAFKQERAKVLYVNTKYVKDVTIFTFRESRHSSYLTSMNMTTLVPFTDNTTFRFEFTNTRLQAFPMRIDLKVCAGGRLKWVREWTQSYTDIPHGCPMPPNTYHAVKFEVPPKNFPMQFNSIDYFAKATFFVTETKEKICELSMELKYGKGV